MDFYVQAVERDGYAVISDVIEAGMIQNILCDLGRVGASAAVSRRAGKAFGIRNLLRVMCAESLTKQSSSLWSRGIENSFDCRGIFLIHSAGRPNK
jgi:hypothetical protein